MNVWTRWPDVDRSRTPQGWSWPANLLVAQGPASWPRGRRASSEAEEILADAVAWWDVERSGFRDGDRWLRNLGTAGGVLDLRLGSSLLANSNDPKWLGPEASGYVYVPGVNNNAITVTDAAALQLTGDISLIAQVAADSWTGLGGLIDRYSTTLQGYSLRLNSGGLRMIWGNGTQTLADSTASVSAAAGDVLWVRADLALNVGGVWQVKFYTSSNGSSWTQLGNTINGGAAASVTYNANDLRVGNTTALNFTLAGRVYRAIVKDGIDGTTVLDVDCDALTSGSATSFTATTGQTVTINRSTSGRKSVAMPSRAKGGRACMLLGSEDFLEVVDAQQHGALNFYGADSFTALIVRRQWGTATTIKTLLSKTNTLQSISTGYAFYDYSTSIYAGLYDGTVAIEPTRPTTAGTLTAATMSRNPTARTYTLRVGSSTTSVADTTRNLTSRITFKIGRESTSSRFSAEMEWSAAAIWRRPLTTREITVLANSGIWGT